MQEYWDMISSEHHQKLITLAEKSGVDLDTALRGIINCLQGENNASGYLDFVVDTITAKQIEDMIDTLTV